MVNRSIILNYIFISMVVFTVTIVGHTTVVNILKESQIQMLWVSLVTIHFFLGLFVGIAIEKICRNRMGLPIGLFVAMIIILLNIWLTIRLNSYLAVFKSEHFQYRFLFGALAASLFGFGIPVIAKLPGRFSNTAKQKNMDSVNIPIQQVILEQTGIRCPICDAFPEESGHYIIRCYHCNAEFCSKHISQYDDRCWRCRTPIPYIKELKYAIKENLSSK